ncbi:zinc finger protein 454-like [Cimex lectularius]|uniref:C2H2-type domain-containing protein n=1 Tax=Cimex lectularius TaxID=79782 RepID=A0A8I6SKQ9_CIMLE|nr:zinc finger protein 454-like [Cimex lectularius]
MPQTQLAVISSLYFAEFPVSIKCFQCGKRINEVELGEEDVCEGDKPFVCNVCCKGYKHLSSLYTHNKYECGKSPMFRCQHCPYACKQKGSFKRHMYCKHSEKYNPTDTKAVDKGEKVHLSQMHEKVQARIQLAEPLEVRVRQVAYVQMSALSLCMQAEGKLQASYVFQAL